MTLKTTMKDGLARTLGFSLAFTFCFAALAAEPRPVTLLEPLKFEGKVLQGAIDPAAAQGLDALPVATGGQTPQGLALVDTAALAHSANAVSCRDYKELTGRGFYADGNFNQTMESFFVSACGTLGILAHARPAQNGAFGDAIAPADLAALPAALLQDVSLEDPGPDSPCAHAASFAACAEERGGAVTADGKGIKFTGDGYTAFFLPALKADIDGDGWEDLVINYSYYPEGGSFRAYAQACVTRKAGEAVARVIPCNPVPDVKP
jgi:hypothetical protein